MDKWFGKVVIVTNVSSGIGTAICKTLVAKRMIVVGFAKNEKKLQVTYLICNGRYELGKLFHIQLIDLFLVKLVYTYAVLNVYFIIHLNERLLQEINN